MVFYTDTGSFSEVDVSGSVLISGSGSSIFSVTGKNNTGITVFDLTAGSNIFQITSASVDVFKINPNGNVHVSGSVIITGSLVANLNLNVSDSSTSNNISGLILSNDNNMSFGLDGSTVTATYNPNFVFSYYNPLDAYNQAVGTFGAGSLFMQPFQLPYDVSCDRLAFPVFMSNAANNNSSVGLNLSMRWGLYTRNASTLNLLTDYSTVMNFQSTLATSNSSLYHGIRLWTTEFSKDIPLAQYYVAILSNLSTTNVPGTIQNVVISQLNTSFWGLWGQAPNQTVQYTRGLGIYSATTNNLPASIAFSQLYGAATGTAAANSTQTNVLRQPIFYLVSQTF